MVILPQARIPIAISLPKRASCISRDLLEYGVVISFGAKERGTVQAFFSTHEGTSKAGSPVNMSSNIAQCFDDLVQSGICKKILYTPGQCLKQGRSYRY